MSLPIPLYGFVIDEEVTVGKNGSPYLTLIVKTVVGQEKGRIWSVSDNVLESPEYPHPGDIIEVTDFDDSQMEQYKNFTINSFRRLSKEELPEDSKKITEFEKASEEDVEWAWSVIEDDSFWENSSLHKLTMKCVEKVGREKFSVCPAATSVHHCYKSGLLVHTAEVLDLARANIECCIKRYPFYKKDVVYASAILHDIGKVNTYSINDFGAAIVKHTEFTIGHLFYGMNLLQSVVDEHSSIGNNYITDWSNEVMHCVAAHHGDPMYGSIAVIQSLEAGLLSRVDYISSRNGMVEYKLKTAIKKGQLPDKIKMFRDTYFTSLGMKEYVTRGTEEN
jgi:3'-5' exoribonuclease